MSEPVRLTKGKRVCEKCSPPRLVELSSWLDHQEEHKWRIRPRPTISKALRERVKERDSYRCVYCGSGSNLEVHHIGQAKVDRMEVLATVCSQCHDKIPVKQRRGAAL